MGVLQNSIDIQKIIASGGDPEIAERVAQLETEIGDENSGIIKDIDDLQEANALIMTSVSAIKITADSAKTKADNAVLWSMAKDYVGYNKLRNDAASRTANNVTFTVNDDKTINVNTTDPASARTSIVLHSYEDGSVLNGLTLKGNPSNVLRLSVEEVGGSYTSYANCYNGNEVLISGIPTNTSVIIYVFIGQGGEVSNVKMEPMLYDASIFDYSPSYEPYLESNEELSTAKLNTSTLKSVTAAAADFAAFKTAIAAL